MSRLDLHVMAVQRKLVLATFVDWLANCLFVLSILVLLTVLFAKFVPVVVPLKVLWIGLSVAALAAAIIASATSPTRYSAAVAIDAKLGLKEKFSTALYVRGVNDPFAQAVVRDAEATAQQVHLAGQFPLQFPRAGLGVIVVAVLALLAFMFVPTFNVRKQQPAQNTKKLQELALADTKVKVKEAIARIEALPAVMKDNEQIQIAKAHLEDLVKHPTGPDPERTARRMMEELSKLDEAVKKQVEQNKAFAEQQQNMKMFKSMQGPVEGKGPVAEAHRKIVEGNVEAAIKELQKAVDEFRQMDPKEKQEAARQMQQLAQELAAMAQDPRAAQKMAEQMKQLGANQQQVQQMQQMMQQAAAGDKQAQQQLQQMQQQIQKQLGLNQQQMQQMQQAVNQAQQAANAQAQAQQMAQAARQMAQAMQQGGQQQMADAQQQMQQMLQQMEAIQKDAEAVAAAQQAMQEAMGQAGGQCNNPGQGGNPRDGQWMDQKQLGWNDGGIGAGERAPKQAAPYGVKQEVSKSAYDEKGKHLASVYVKDRSIRGEAKMELRKVAEAAAAEAGEDIDDAMVDRRSLEVKRKYFQRMADEAGK